MGARRITPEAVWYGSTPLARALSLLLAPLGWLYCTVASLRALAYRHGWHRIASYEEDDFDWRWDSVGREFWHYQRTDGLTWWQAMLEIYDLETMERTYGWSVCVDELGIDPRWLGPKGVPTPVPESH